MNGTATVFDIRVLRAAQIVRDAEYDLGTLTDGQRRDLLMDNTEWDSDDIRAIVDYLRRLPSGGGAIQTSQAAVHLHG